jgi:hypothetical protein
MDKLTLFDFNNISYTKFPTNVKVRFLFEDELVSLQNTEYYLEVSKNHWLIYDENNDNVFTMTFDQFLDIYIGSNQKSQRYLEFIIDSKNNDYRPTIDDPSTVLYEEIFGDLIEKPAPIKKDGDWYLI